MNSVGRREVFKSASEKPVTKGWYGGGSIRMEEGRLGKEWDKNWLDIGPGASCEECWLGEVEKICKRLLLLGSQWIDCGTESLEKVICKVLFSNIIHSSIETCSVRCSATINFTPHFQHLPSPLLEPRSNSCFSFLGAFWILRFMFVLFLCLLFQAHILLQHVVRILPIYKW